MTPNPRQAELLARVVANGSASIESLAEVLGVTLQTIRRDAQQMAQAGLLARFHGGVRVPSSTVENIAYRQRQTLHLQAKQRIARAVAKAVPNGCSLILNIGTTTEAIARAYLEYLYSEEGQDLAGKHFYRPTSPAAAAKYGPQFVKVELFTIEQAFGGWARAQAEHFADGATFDQIYLKQ